MKRKIELQLRQIETDLGKSLTEITKPAPHYAVKRMIRDKVQQVYNLGCGYACNHFKLKPFTVAEDFLEIGKITDDVYRGWQYGRNLQSALISLTSVTLAKATKAKARQIVSGTQTDGIPFWTMTAAVMRMNSVRQFLDVSSDEDQLPIDEGDQLTAMMTWETEGDALVCPECDALDGQEWQVDDPDIPTPVLDTHPNCRCRLVLV
jgi:hypothetical protein